MPQAAGDLGDQVVRPRPRNAMFEGLLKGTEPREGACGSYLQVAVNQGIEINRIDIDMAQNHANNR